MQRGRFHSDSLRATGVLAESFSRAGQVGSSVTLVSGTLWLVAVPLEQGTVVTALNYWSTGTALSGGTNKWAALYDSALALMAQSTTDTDAADWGTNTKFTFTLSAAQTISTSGLYYAGLMVAASTPPTILGVAGNSVLWGAAPKLTGTSTASLTDTAPNPAAAISAAGSMPYVNIT